MKFEKIFKIFRQYLNTASPTGCEHAGQKLWMDYIKPYVDSKNRPLWDSLRNHQSNASFKVIIEAHADEISWYVNYITEDGLIYVIRNGVQTKALLHLK